nr:odorant receptor 4-like [Onthophagus taurus]
MVRSVNDESYQPETKIQQELIRKNMRSAQRTTMTYFALAMSTGVIWLLYPLITQTKAEIFSVYVPFDTSYSPVYEIFYFVKGYSLMLHAMANTSKDSIVVLIMAHICGQLDIVDDKLTKLKETALEKIKNGYQKNLSDTMNELLIKSVQRHKLILNLNKEFNDVYTFAILAQFTTSVLIICVILYQISVLSVTSMVFFSMINYLFCMMLQLSVYCWHGNEVILKSSHLYRSVYNIDWPDTSITFKKNMLYFMCNVKKPIKIYAGNFFEVSLESYMAILRSSWSYFAVLKNSRDEIKED